MFGSDDPFAIFKDVASNFASSFLGHMSNYLFLPINKCEDLDLNSFFCGGLPNRLISRGSTVDDQLALNRIKHLRNLGGHFFVNDFLLVGLDGIQRAYRSILGGDNHDGFLSQLLLRWCQGFPPQGGVQDPRVDLDRRTWLRGLLLRWGQQDQHRPSMHGATRKGLSVAPVTFRTDVRIN